MKVTNEEGERKMYNLIKDLSKKYEDYAISIRRELHQHPELGGHEVWTSSRICEELNHIGIPFTIIDKYNIIAKIDSGKPGKAIALRCDIDALPLVEENDCSYKSLNHGCMHACGHDANTAIMLGTCKVLMDIKDDLNGIIYICFQMGEEIGIGALEIVEYLKSQGGVEHVMAIHVNTEFEVGQMAMNYGSFLSGVSLWELNVNGVSGHGARPHSCIDPIKPACEILLRYTSIPVNRISATDLIIVSPCYIQAGTVSNIFPSNAVVKGTVRFTEYGTFEKAKEYMGDIAKHIAASYGATSDLVYSSTLPPVINDIESVKIAREVVAKTTDFEVVDSYSLGGDNFSVFTEAFPGFYCKLGAGNKDKGIYGGHHSSKFEIDERVLKIGCQLMSSWAWTFVTKSDK